MLISVKTRIYSKGTPYNIIISLDKTISESSFRCRFGYPISNFTGPLRLSVCERNGLPENNHFEAIYVILVSEISTSMPSQVTQSKHFEQDNLILVLYLNIHLFSAIITKSVFKKFVVIFSIIYYYISG